MALPLLEYSPISQNKRVKGFEVPGDEQPFLFNTNNMLSSGEVEELIDAAYRQVFHEQQMVEHNRQVVLESQLKANQITVREFIRGLALSDSFSRLNYEVNNNYRFVELCIQRLLGRHVYHDREKIAWSIVIATQGKVAFIDTILNSQEYLESFGEHTVPFQQRRILPQRITGELPFARMPRYGTDYRDKLPSPHIKGGYFRSNLMSPLLWKAPSFTGQVGKAIAYSGGTLLTLLVISIFLSFFGLLPL